VTGALRVESEDGELLKEASKVALCRCGGTASPPFCDGTHNRIQYRSKR
jgi:CDGSH-type Zn-finger protein